MLVACIEEAAFVQHGRPGDIAEVQDLLHVVVHESLDYTALVAVAGTAVVVEALLQSMVGLGSEYRSR